MFRLRDLKNGLYQIHKKNGPAYEGTPKLIFKRAVQLGVVEEELTAAVTQLTYYGHDYADFGVYGRLMWTKKNGEE